MQACPIPDAEVIICFWISNSKKLVIAQSSNLSGFLFKVSLPLRKLTSPNLALFINLLNLYLSPASLQFVKPLERTVSKMELCGTTLVADHKTDFTTFTVLWSQSINKLFTYCISHGPISRYKSVTGGQRHGEKKKKKRGVLTVCCVIQLASDLALWERGKGRELVLTKKKYNSNDLRRNDNLLNLSKQNERVKNAQSARKTCPSQDPVWSCISLPLHAKSSGDATPFLPLPSEYSKCQ